MFSKWNKIRLGYIRAIKTFFWRKKCKISWVTKPMYQLKLRCSIQPCVPSFLAPCLLFLAFVRLEQLHRYYKLPTATSLSSTVPPPFFSKFKQVKVCTAKDLTRFDYITPRAAPIFGQAVQCQPSGSWTHTPRGSESNSRQADQSPKVYHFRWPGKAFILAPISIGYPPEE